MTRYRLLPTPEQEVILREHCTHARFVYNLCVEQNSWWRAGRKQPPNWAQRCLQLTEARAENAWLSAGSVNVQQQAIRTFDQALRNFFKGTHRKPKWHKAGRDEGFGIAGKCGASGGACWDLRRHSRHVGAIRIPKVGWVKFRWSQPVPGNLRSFRVNLDRSGRWHVGFNMIPTPIPAPGNGEIVGVDRGVAVNAALSTGEMLLMPRLRDGQIKRLKLLKRRLRRGEFGSARRERVRRSASRLLAREADMRKDWCEKTSTDLARRFDVIRVEDLKIGPMTRSAKGTAESPGKGVHRKAGLNREIMRSGWGLMVRRLEQKAPGRVEKVKAAYTSQRCSCCGHVARESRESQALFRCTACGHSENADVNAAKNIAAGHAVTARGGFRVAGPLNREPQAA